MIVEATIHHVFVDALEFTTAKANRQEHTLTAALVGKGVPRNEFRNVGIISVFWRENIEARILFSANLVPTLVEIAEFIHNKAILGFCITETIPIIKNRACRT